MTSAKDKKPAASSAAHPGAILNELMTLHGIDRRQLHLATGMDIMRVYNLLDGVRAVTADTALRLGTFFEQDPHYWMRLQAEYDLKQLDHGAVKHAVHPVSANRWQSLPKQRARREK